MFPLSVNIYFQIVCLIIGFFCWKSIKSTWLVWFVPYLIFILIVELTGRYLYSHLRQPNVWLYNLSIPVEYLFFAFIFYKNYTQASNKYLARWFIILFTVFTCLTLIFIQGLGKFNSSSLLVGSFFMLVFSIVYFSELYLCDEPGNFLQQPMFWIGVGILFFNAGEFTYNLFSGYLVTEKWDQTAAIFKNINNKLLLLLYTSFAAAFICQKIFGKYRKV